MSIDGRQIHHSAIYLIENPKVSKIGKIFSAPANSAKRRLPRREAIVASYSLGYFLTAFDLTPDLSAHCHSHWKLVCSGSRCIEVSFETAPKITINCIVYSEYDNFLEIDSTPQILTDFNAIMLEQKTTVVCPLHPHDRPCCVFTSGAAVCVKKWWDTRTLVATCIAPTSHFAFSLTYVHTDVSRAIHNGLPN